MSLLASCVFSPLIYANTFSEIMLPRQTLFPLCHTCFAITFSSNLFMKWKCVKLSHEKSEQWKKRGVVAVGEQLMKTDPQHSLAIFWFWEKTKQTLLPLWHARPPHQIRKIPAHVPPPHILGHLFEFDLDVIIPFYYYSM